MPTPDDTKQPRDKKKLLARIHDRYRVMVDADRENRQKALEDLKFLHEPGAQWDYRIRLERGTRPCYEFNKTRIKVKRIVNEMRANRPSGQVRAVEDSDKDKAEIFEGLCRNIDNISDLDTIADYAGEYQVGAGMGAWRIETDYLDEDSFVQDIRAVPIKNPFCLYADPASQDPLKRDAEDWILTEKISKSSFKAKYPKADEMDFETPQFDDHLDWEDEETVRICEYWYKEPYDKEIWQVEVPTPDGGSEIKTIASTDPAAATVDPASIKRKRTSKCYRIMQCIASGSSILEGPTEQAGRNHRFVVVYGEWVVVGGKIIWFGLTRNAKDAQRSYNTTRTAVTETIAGTPLSHTWVTPKQAEGNAAQWNRAITENLPWLTYTPDPQAPGPPQRAGGADVPVALIKEMELADQELKDVTGVYDASLGERSNEKSGVAIARRSEQTQIVNYNYADNMAKARKRTWEIYIDLIPEIYDTERVVRILGRDGAEKYLKVNEAKMHPVTLEPVVLNDLSQGKYDVTVSTGPSFSTQRQEAAEIYGQMAQGNPQIMAVAGDLYFKALDLPYSNEISDRLKTLLPPQIQQQLNQDKPAPPEVQAMMAQAQQAMQQVQQMGQMVQAAAAEATGLKTEAEKAVSDLNVKQAQFDADVAKETAGIVLKQANLALAEAKAQAMGVDDSNSEARAALAQEVQQAILAINQMGAQFMQHAVATMADIQAKQQPQVIVHAPPRPRVVAVNRVNGSLIPQYEDQQAPTP